MHHRDASRRRALVTLGSLGVLGLTGALAPIGSARAQAGASAWPSRPIKLIIPFLPGGATDIVGRLVSSKLSEALGQPVVPENRPGGGSNIGSELVAKAPPDGYTLLLGTIANATNMSIYKQLHYDTLRDFVPITQTMSAPSVLVVAPSLGVNDLASLIALAKSKPGNLSFASSGAGGSPHLAGEMLKMRAGIDMIHVPYKGAAGATADVLSGQVSMGFMTALSAIPFMQAGKLRPIAVAAKRRLAQIPNVPTMAEAGLPDFEVSSWNGLLAPAKTSPEIVARLHREVVRILALPEVKTAFEAQASEPVGNTPEEFRAYIAAEIEKWGKVVKASGARID